MSMWSASPAPDAQGVTSSGTAWSRFGVGEPVVLIHGVGMNQSVWAPQVQGLRSEFQVLVYDMLGHGKSRFAEDANDIGDYANQLVGLMAELQCSSAHIVGHSMGALIALEMVIAHPELCKSVMALNGVYLRTPEQRASVQARANELATRGKPDSVKDTIDRWFGNPVPAQDEPAAELSEHLLKEVPLNGYARAYDIFARSDERHKGRLSKIAVPVSIATGAQDPNSSPAMAQAMATEIPGSELQVLPNQRHMMSLVAVDEVNALIRNFVKQHSNASAAA